MLPVVRPIQLKIKQLLIAASLPAHATPLVAGEFLIISPRRPGWPKPGQPANFLKTLNKP